MGQYLHLYETAEAFEADYNGEAYHKPWVSLSPRLTVTGLTMEDNFCYTYGGTWEYECERDAVDMEGAAPGPMGTQHVYEWSYLDTSMSTPVTLHAATLVRNPSVGTQIYESGENYGEWFFVSTNPSEVLTVSGTSSEHPDKVDYNKRPGMPEITYDMAFGDGPTVTCDNFGTLTCESLENSAVTYPILVHVLNDPNAESEAEYNYDFVGTLRFNYIAHETWGDVYYWSVYDNNENPYDIGCICQDGNPHFYIPE